MIATTDLTELRAALASAESRLIAARQEEDRRLIEGMDRLMAGLELGDDAGAWHPVYLAASLLDALAAVLAGAVRRVRGA